MVEGALVDFVSFYSDVVENCLCIKTAARQRISNQVFTFHDWIINYLIELTMVPQYFSKTHGENKLNTQSKTEKIKFALAGERTRDLFYLR
jgi:hypothetical protein